MKNIGDMAKRTFIQKMQKNSIFIICNKLVPLAIGSNCKNTKNHTRAVKFVWVTKCWTGTYLRFWVVDRTFVWQIIRRRGFLGSTHKKIIELEGHTDNQIHTLISYTSPLSSRYLFYSISLNGSVLFFISSFFIRSFFIRSFFIISFFIRSFFIHYFFYTFIFICSIFIQFIFYMVHFL